MGRIFFYSIGLMLSSQLSDAQSGDVKKRGFLRYNSIESKNKKDDRRSMYNQDKLSSDKQHEYVRKQAVLNLVLNVQYLPEYDEYTTDISYRKSSRSSKAPTLDSFSCLQNLFNSKEAVSFKSQQKPIPHHCIYKDTLDHQMNSYFCKSNNKIE
ncbi:MAG: hypothetical protein ACXWL5_04375 [Candidatus Chromulinivorax sp.]